MRNNLVLLSLFASMFTACSISPVNTGVASSSQAIGALEELSWDLSLEKVKTQLGEPPHQAFDETTKTRVIRYLDSNTKTARSRSHLVFQGQPEVLVQKYVTIYESDPESVLSFWRKKLASTDLEIHTVTMCQGHSVGLFQFVDISKFQRLEIENGNIVRIFWQKAPFSNEVLTSCK